MDLPVRTHGQIAYEAWWTAFSSGTQTDLPEAWHRLSPEAKWAWEHTANTLRDHLLRTLPILEGLTYPRRFTVEYYEPPPEGSPHA